MFSFNKPVFLALITILIISTTTIMSCKESVAPADKSINSAIYNKFLLLAKATMSKSMDYSIDRVLNNEKILQSDFSSISNPVTQQMHFNLPKDTSYSAEFKTMIESFVSRIKEKTYFSNNNDVMQFFLENAQKLKKEEEKEFAAEIITSAVAFNDYIRDNKNSSKWLQFQLKGGTYVRNFKPSQTATVGGFVAIIVVSFVIGFITDPICHNIDTPCTFWSSLLSGIIYAGAAFFLDCEAELLPWKQTPTNDRNGQQNGFTCFGQV
jgi:hypothetical protein